MSLALAVLWFVAPVEVLVVSDPELPPVSAEATRALLRGAEQAMRHRFGVAAPLWESSRILTPEAAAALLDPTVQQRCQERFAGHVVRQLSDFDRPSLRLEVARFLKRWPLAALTQGWPDISDYDQLARRMLTDMRAQAETWLVTRGFGRRFSDWMCWLAQHDDTVVLTNLPIHFDWLSEPFPHTVQNGSLLSGATVVNQRSRALLGRSILVSLSPEATPIDEPAALGEFILAHELGHALLRIPDVYDHGPGCLMNTAMQHSRAQQVHELRQRPGRCGKCRAHMAARRAFERMQRLATVGRLQQAEQTMRRAFHQLPADSDGPLPEWRSQWLTELAQRALTAHRVRSAMRWSTEALAEWPENVAALRILQQARGVSPSAR